MYQASTYVVGLRTYLPSRSASHLGTAREVHCHPPSKTRTFQKGPGSLYVAEPGGRRIETWRVSINLPAVPESTIVMHRVCKASLQCVFSNATAALLMLRDNVINSDQCGSNALRPWGLSNPLCLNSIHHARPDLPELSYSSCFLILKSDLF